MLGVVKSEPFQMNTKAEVGQSTGDVAGSGISRTKGSRHVVHHEEAHSAADVPARCRRHARAAAARRDDAGGHCAGADGAAQPKTRFVGIFFPHGMAPGYWEPQAEGALPDEAAVHPRVARAGQEPDVGLSGLWSKSAEPPEGTTGSDHWVAAAYLTGIKPRKTAGADATVGSPTIDQHHRAEDRPGHAAARRCSSRSRIRTRARATAARATAALHELDFVDRPADAVHASRCMRTAPLPMELNPQVVFERLFGSGGTPELRAARLHAAAQHPRFAASAS